MNEVYESDNEMQSVLDHSNPDDIEMCSPRNSVKFNENSNSPAPRECDATTLKINDDKIQTEIVNLPQKIEKENDLKEETVVEKLDNVEIKSAYEVINEEFFFSDKIAIEVARCSWKQSHYLRGCLWSPDGTCCLTAVNGDGMHLFELPQDFYTVDAIDINRPFNILQSAVNVPDTGTVYDMCWYPYMHSSLPETCCWLASRQHEPVHMWDAFDGKLRCSYRGYNEVDEVEAALSIAFSIDAQSIFAGYRKSLKIFNTAVPGKDCQTFKVKVPVSCIATNPNDLNNLALGSWNKEIFLFDTRSDIIDNLHGHKGGVTYMKFSPNGEYLFTGSRKEACIYKWDMRDTTKPLNVFNRLVDTNQRIYFDISKQGNWLLSGDTSGMVHIWNLNSENIKRKKLSFPLHRDCCNGISLHPSKKILATSSGQHHNIDSLVENNEDDSLEITKIDKNQNMKKDENSIVFWWFGKCNEL